MLKDFNRIYTLEIDLNNLQTSYDSKALYANTDLNTATLLIKLILDGKPLDVTDKTVTAFIKTSIDENMTVQKCEFLEEGVVGLNFKESALKVGVNTFFIEIKSEYGEIINTPLIEYKVIELLNVFDTIKGENENAILKQLASEIQIVKTMTDDLKKDFLLEIENIKEKIELMDSDIKNIKEKIELIDSNVESINEKK